MLTAVFPDKTPDEKLQKEIIRDSRPGPTGLSMGQHLNSRASWNATSTDESAKLSYLVFGFRLFYLTNGWLINEDSFSSAVVL